MANPPPPLIRSSKAFSVEIPEGSNSAKAKRSDIVANDELDIHHKTSHFHDSLPDLQSASVMRTPAGGHSESVFAETTSDPSDQFHHEADGKTGEDRFVVDNAKSNTERRLAVDDSAESDHLAQLPAQANEAGDNLQSLPDDSFKDRFAHDESNKAFKDRLVGETQMSLNDHPVSAGAHALNSNVPGIAQDALHDHLQGLPENSASGHAPPVMNHDDIKDSHQPGMDSAPLSDRFGHESNQALHDRFGSEKNTDIKDRLAGAGEETQAHNRLGLPDDSIHNGRTAMEQAPEPTKNTQALADEHLHDNNQSMANQALHDNLQSLGDQSFANHRQGLDDEALHLHSATLPSDESAAAAQSFNAGQRLNDNHASLADEAFHSRHDELEKSPVKDHIELLPDTHQPLRPGPSPIKKDVDGHTGTGPVPAADDHHHSSALHTGHSAPSEISKAEHAKRMEEFHGRVEAIRKSVSGINHLLDDLQDKH